MNCFAFMFVFVFFFCQDKLRSHDVICFPAMQGNVHNNGKYFLGINAFERYSCNQQIQESQVSLTFHSSCFGMFYFFPLNIRLRLAQLRSRCWHFHTFRNDIAVCLGSLGPLGLYVFPVHEDFPVVSMLLYIYIFFTECRLVKFHIGNQRKKSAFAR